MKHLPIRDPVTVRLKEIERAYMQSQLCPPDGWLGIPEIDLALECSTHIPELLRIVKKERDKAVLALSTAAKLRGYLFAAGAALFISLVLLIMAVATIYRPA